MANKVAKTKTESRTTSGKKRQKPLAVSRAKTAPTKPVVSVPVVTAKVIETTVSPVTTVTTSRSMIMIPAADQFGKNAQQAVEEINAFTRESWDVALKSATAVSKGWEETIRSAHNLAQESLARTMSASKTLFGAKTPREVLDLQTEFLKDQFDHIVASTGKLSELSTRLTKEAIEPVAQHTNNALNKIWNKRAA